MKEDNLNKKIDRIEDGLLAIYNGEKGSIRHLLKTYNVPYYNKIIPALRKRNLLEPKGSSYIWIGDKPTRTLAGILYEEISIEERARFSEVYKDIKKKRQASKPKKETVPAPTANNEEPTVDIRWTDDPQYAPPTLDMTRALALMEHAIKHGVKDPVAFTEACLQDPRI